MSRSRRQHTPRGCSGCSACSWFPKEHQREGKRTAKVCAREAAEAADLDLIHYDAQCESGALDDLESA